MVIYLFCTKYQQPNKGDIMICVRVYNSSSDDWQNEIQNITNISSHRGKK